MALPPNNPLALTGVTLSGISLSVDGEDVKLNLSQVSRPMSLSPSMARQLAEWLVFFADKSDENIARLKEMQNR